MILLERKSYREYFSKRGLEKSPCIAAKRCCWICSTHPYTFTEGIKNAEEKAYFQKRMCITKENAKASNSFNAQQSQN